MKKFFVITSILALTFIVLGAFFIASPESRGGFSAPSIIGFLIAAVILLAVIAFVFMQRMNSKDDALLFFERDLQKVKSDKKSVEKLPATLIRALNGDRLALYELFTSPIFSSSSLFSSIDFAKNYARAFGSALEERNDFPLRPLDTLIQEIKNNAKRSEVTVSGYLQEAVKAKGMRFWVNGYMSSVMTNTEADARAFLRKCALSLEGKEFQEFFNLVNASFESLLENTAELDDKLVILDDEARDYISNEEKIFIQELQGKMNGTAVAEVSEAANEKNKI